MRRHFTLSVFSLFLRIESAIASEITAKNVKKVNFRKKNIIEIWENTCTEAKEYVFLHPVF